MGLIILHPDPAQANGKTLSVDIVAVHGLNGDPVDTWTEPKSKAFWLKDFLPDELSGARIMTFGYNADAAFGNSTADVIDHGKDLLGSLIDEREQEDVSDHFTISFISNSLLVSSSSFIYIADL